MALTAKFGELRDPQLKAYISGITERIRTSDPRCGSNSAPFNTIILDTPIPIALSSQGGFIIISRGLISSLQVESQLAFVLGHEMSHHLLGQLNTEEEAEISTEEYLDREEPADRLGVACIARAGYDPRPALSTVLILAQRVESQDGNLQIQRSALNAVAEGRSHALYDYLVESKWRPPGTVDRLDYQVIRRSLKP